MHAHVLRKVISPQDPWLIPLVLRLSLVPEYPAWVTRRGFLGP